MLTRAQAKLIRKLKSRKRREQEGAFLVEGVRLCEDLLASDLQVQLLVMGPALAATPRGRRLAERVEVGGLPYTRVSDSELARMADTETPQGILAVAQKPVRRLSDFSPRGDCAIVVFDGVGDPGNLGTLIRTAEALGVAWTVALPGTVDPWSPKTVRAAAGSLFRLPVSQELWSDVSSWLRARSFAILCADVGGEPVSRSVSGGGRFALVLGSEPAGPSEQVVRDCDKVVAVQLQGGIDSLNVAVAGALLLDRLLGGRGAG